MLPFWKAKFNFYNKFPLWFVSNWSKEEKSEQVVPVLSNMKEENNGVNGNLNLISHTEAFSECKPCHWVSSEGNGMIQRIQVAWSDSWKGRIDLTYSKPCFPWFIWSYLDKGSSCASENWHYAWSRVLLSERVLVHPGRFFFMSVFCTWFHFVLLK